MRIFVKGEVVYPYSDWLETGVAIFIEVKGL